MDGFKEVMNQAAWMPELRTRSIVATHTVKWALRSWLSQREKINQSGRLSHFAYGAIIASVECGKYVACLARITKQTFYKGIASSCIFQMLCSDWNGMSVAWENLVHRLIVMVYIAWNCVFDYAHGWEWCSFMASKKLAIFAVASGRANELQKLCSAYCWKGLHLQFSDLWLK